MAGDWIKMRVDLASSPKVVRIASALCADRLRVIGGLHAVWSLFDAHSSDGVLDGYTTDAMDELIGFRGFAAAMVSVGWLLDDGDALRATRFDEHNGQSAKRRAMETERKRNERNVSASDADEKRSREEKRREEPIPSLLTQAPAPLTPSGPQLALVDQKPKGPPDCPHLAVLALWAEVLPAMPQHLTSQWKGARADHLRARWRETAAEKAWTDEAQGLAYLRKLFAYVGQSPFLTGKASQRDPTKRPFVIELEWLVNPANWAKVHEGKYHQESA